MDNKQTEAQAIANLSQLPFISETHTSFPVAFVPVGDGQWNALSLEAFQSEPSRKKGTIQLHDVDSFIEASQIHGVKDCSMIYIDADYANNRVSATAVFNDHGSTDIGWRDHRATFTPRQNKSWKEWIEQNKKPMNQIELANFFEQNLSDFTSAEGKPSGAQVLEFVLCLQETRTVRYGSAVNLQNGMVKLEFTEDNDKAQKGQLEMFKDFALGIAPFFGGDAYQVNAFLRYRINRNTGEITFWYELQKPEKVLESACSDMISRIGDKTGLTVMFGIPDSRS